MSSQIPRIIKSAELVEILAVFVADRLNLVTDQPGGHPLAKVIEQTGVGAGHADVVIDDHWTPASDDFLARIHADLVAEAVTEACGKDAAAKLQGLKKPERVAAAAKMLAGTGWLPKPLRGPGYALKKADAKPAAAKGKPAKKVAKKVVAKKATAKK